MERERIRVSTAAIDRIGRNRRAAESNEAVWDRVIVVGQHKLAILEKKGGKGKRRTEVGEAGPPPIPPLDDAVPIGLLCPVTIDPLLLCAFLATLPTLAGWLGGK
jgi:hypothetical protein